jgi:tetratricopeptide (TPR) repeat protein
MKNLSLLLLLQLLVATISVHASSGSGSGKRPPFLSHVSDQDIEWAKQIAEKRHRSAVQQALDSYPTHLQPSTLNPSIQKNQTFQEYVINSPGSLPDFGDQLDRRVLVTNPPLLSRPECQDVIAMAEAYFAAAPTQSITQTSGQYTVSGFYIRAVPAVHAWFVRACQTQLFPLLARAFSDFIETPADLCVDNAYLFKYTRETGGRTDVHTDSGCLSFTIALNDEYEGGGTWVEGLGVLEMTAGQVTIRPGGIKHCGNAVESGTRYIIGGFCLHKKKAELVRQLCLPSPDVTTEQRIKALEAAVVLNPNCDVPYNLLANAYEEQGHVEKAQHVLEYCLTHVHATSGEIAYSLASIYMCQGLHEKARACLQICLEADPGDVDAMLSMAQTCAALGDKQSEEENYRKLVNTPGAKDAAVASAYCNLGVLYEGSDKEIECYIKSLEIALNSFAPRYSLACAYASRKQWDLACTAFRYAIECADSEESKTKVLKLLYQAAASLIQLDKTAPASREEMLNRFKAVMGEDNYNLLAAQTQRG